jgi:tetratricopeptide (TPR) repeat protein
MLRAVRSEEAASAPAASRGKKNMPTDDRQSASRPIRSSGAASGGAIALASAILALVAVACYHNSFVGAWVFDDHVGIVTNQNIRHLWPLWAPMIGTVRPLVAWSFAMNYALGGVNTWGYHAVNLAIHLAAALVLFGIVRRTLSSGRLAARFGGAAWGLALAVALLWLVHPLQTQSVTYIYQRYESLMGLFFLLTLYGFIRAQDASHPNRWYAASVACCLLAVTSKEVAAVAPLLVLWYDRALVASSWREIVRRRWAYYVGLAGTWPILAALMLSQAHRFAGAGVLVVKNVTPWQYAISQPGVIAHYLRLCFWPTDLCIDYGWPVAATAVAIIPPLLLIVALLALTAWAIFRWPAWSFLGAWFFLILAPTSSVFPIRDLAFEHRMYLPLAAVVVGVVIGGWTVGQWLVGREKTRASVLPIVGGALVAFAAVAIGLLTLERNADYRSELIIWQDTVAKAPHNERAHGNLGLRLVGGGRIDDGIAEYHKALEIRPDFLPVHNDLGLALSKSGRFDEAIAHHERVLEFHPENPEAHNGLGVALAGRRRIDEAIVQYQKAIELKPDYAEAHYNLGAAFAGYRRLDEAIDQYQQALQIDPVYAEAYNNLGSALAHCGRTDEAIVQLQKALEVRPDYANAHCNLGIVLADRGRIDEAIDHYQKALELKPDYAAAQNNLGMALASRGRIAEAVAHFRKALELQPDFAEARKNLATALDQQGKAD